MTEEQRRTKQIIGMLALCICGAVVYELPYLSWSYYDVVLESYQVTDAQMGYLMSAYGIACVACYLPAGWLADRFRAGHLIASALLLTSIIGAIVSMFPPYPVLVVCYIGYGIATTLPLWNAMMKATRELGESSEMGRLYGFLEGGRGFLPVIYGAFIIPIFHMMGEDVNAFRTVIWYFVILGLACAVLAWFGIKKLREDPEEQKDTKEKVSFSDYKIVIKNKQLWLLTLLMFCCFMIYESYSYITPYLTNFFGLSTSLGAIISLIKSYGLAVFGGIAAGFIADKIHSNPKVVSIGFFLMVLGLCIFIISPAEPSWLVIALITILVLSLGLFMVRALYFAIIDEIKIPLKYTGMAVGFASVIGCLPQTFIYSVTGNLLERFPGRTGYLYMFFYMLASAALGGICAYMLYRSIKKDKAEGRA
ncbi:MAG: MFS transporter [Lachnospiraceae bacterium]|nr:MFS transporter [Lachnospiraceae bacterium]